MLYEAFAKFADDGFAGPAGLSHALNRGDVVGSGELTMQLGGGGVSEAGAFGQEPEKMLGAAQGALQ
jgi:hypothetical protein